MPEATNETQETGSSEFAREAGRKEASFFSEYVSFLRHGKKWYLAPVLVLLVIAGAFVVIGGTVAAPLIYALF